MVRKYEEFNGTAFTLGTKKEVRDVLENARIKDTRIRIWYGDNVTGESWLDEFAVVGTVGRSTGMNKVPLMVNNSRSMGGGEMQTRHIIRIDDIRNKKTLYHHPKFHVPFLKTVDLKEKDPTIDDKYRYQVQYRETGEEVASFPTGTGALRYIKFLNGGRYSK